MNPRRKLGPQCIVCKRLGARMDPALQVYLCEECAGDPFRRDEAVRRIACD